MAEWIEIVVQVLSLVGGGAGISAVIKASNDRKKNNMDGFKTLLDEAQEERQLLKRELQEVKVKTNDIDERNSALTRAFNAAWRCRLVEQITDCPVVQTFNKGSNTCVSKETGKESKK